MSLNNLLRFFYTSRIVCLIISIPFFLHPLSICICRYCLFLC